VNYAGRETPEASPITSLNRSELALDSSRAVIWGFESRELEFPHTIRPEKSGIKTGV